MTLLAGDDIAQGCPVWERTQRGLGCYSAEYKSRLNLKERVQFPHQWCRKGLKRKPVRRWAAVVAAFFELSPKEWEIFVNFNVPGELDQTLLFNCLDFYHDSPDSGERQYKSRI